jgi:hypothetical protein
VNGRKDDLAAGHGCAHRDPPANTCESAPLSFESGQDANLRIDRTTHLSLDLSRALDFVGFGSRAAPSRAQNFPRMLDFCWISLSLEHMFAWLESSKIVVDQGFRVVGGDGFEPPTPAL